MSCLDEKEEYAGRSSGWIAARFEKVTKDFKALDAEISELREKEQLFEKGQEGFYQMFKAAVAEVQSAKNKIGEWENRNREFVLEKERLDLRREEILRQIEQAGRRAEEFASYRSEPEARGDLARDGAAHVPLARRSGVDRRGG